MSSQELKGNSQACPVSLPTSVQILYPDANVQFASVAAGWTHEGAAQPCHRQMQTPAGT